MVKRLKNISTPESDFEYGIDTRQVISDTENVRGELWLYVNKHPDNSTLIKALLKLQKQPAKYSRPLKKGQALFGYEFIFKKGTQAIKDIRKAGFKVV